MRRSWAPQLLSILRIVVAFMFTQVGSAKWFVFPAAVMPGGPGPWSLDAMLKKPPSP